MGSEREVAHFFHVYFQISCNLVIHIIHELIKNTIHSKFLYEKIKHCKNGYSFTTMNTYNFLDSGLFRLFVLCLNNHRILHKIFSWQKFGSFIKIRYFLKKTSIQKYNKFLEVRELKQGRNSTPLNIFSYSMDSKESCWNPEKLG